MNLDKLKDKVVRLEKENREIKAKTKDAENLCQQALLQQDDSLKKHKLLEDKIDKLEKKVASYKSEAKSKES